eukprot:CAMPEP_0176446816 /NCGR_PEP_ID=MMETSP0127-20121128/24576_1 /TAXON_ID=938130 /ORGANISM="Platyophrya macrostoma, Strain WH" /LENGTH=546 /DNA_ID=CAMNT_0017832973 /DNA_START=42 /DNA_END=1682 /DNA_ORIENTATION=-
MLASDTRSILQDLLHDIAGHERQIEVLRQILCEQPDFESYATFRRIDRLRRGFITAADITEFLLSNGIHHSEEECELLINHYDRDCDGRLQYSELLPILLPMDNPELRTIVTQRKVYDVGYDEFLPYEVEYALARLFAREIDYQTETDYLKIELANQRGFSIFNAFTAIDAHESGFIDYTNLRSFFKRQGKLVKDDDVVAILRRIDRDDDGKLTYEEFAAAIRPQGPSIGRTFKPGSRPGDEEIARSPGSRTKKLSVRGSPARSPLRTGKTLSKAKSPAREQKSILKSTRKVQSPSKSQSLSTSRSKISKASSSKDKDINEQLIRFFREFINLEKEVELTKQDLALRTDFNLFDAYRLFDQKGRGLISVNEIEQGFQDLEIYPNKEDVYLFIKRFDRDGDGKLKFTDFVDACAPIQPEYYKQLKARIPINGDLYFDPQKLFSTQTRRLLKALFIQHIENESVVEALRQRLVREPTFNFKDIFAFIDQDEDGQITVYELRIAFDRYDVFASEKEINYLINRFDKNEDKKISYAEFVAEINPKSQKAI